MLFSLYNLRPIILCNEKKNNHQMDKNKDTPNFLNKLAYLRMDDECQCFSLLSLLSQSSLLVRINEPMDVLYSFCAF